MFGVAPQISALGCATHWMCSQSMMVCWPVFF